MKHIFLIAVFLTATLVGYAQTHIKPYIQKMINEHPEWVVNYKKSETGNASNAKSGQQSNLIYQLSIDKEATIDSILTAFDTDKMEGYSYIRTSAVYNQLTRKRSRKTVALQNGESLDCHSTEYSFVSLSVIDPDDSRYRTNYILKWNLPKDGLFEAKLYILHGQRPNN